MARRNYKQKSASSRYWEGKKDIARTNGVFVTKLITWEQSDRREHLWSEERHEAVKSYIKEHGLMFYGEDHQTDSFCGVPLFNDGSVVTYTMRAWGAMMAEVWGGTYIDFYIKDLSGE